MKIFLIVAAVLISIQTFAQDALKMGYKIVGGGLSIRMSDNENERPYNNYDEDYFRESTDFSFSPYYGRLYDDYTMIGLRLSLNSNRSETERTADNYLYKYDDKSSSIGLGGFLRKYFPATDKFGFFIESGINLNRGTSRDEDRWLELQDSAYVIDNHFQRDNISYTASIDAEGGMYFFLIPRLSIETNFIQFVLSYSDSKNEYEDFINNRIEEGDGNSTNVQLNLINSFSFNKLFTINYYF